MVNKLPTNGRPRKAAKTLTPNPPAAVKPFTYKGPDNAVIRLTPKGAQNPKRGGSAAYGLFALYGKGGLTVTQYLAAVEKANPPRKAAARYAIGWDIAYGFITVS